MTPAGRTGVMGGTFDPIHLGHLAAASAAAGALGLDRVLFVPANHPPHRSAAPRVSVFHRFALVALAIAGDERFLASDLEISRPGPSFTSDTLRRLHALGYAPSQLFFILGSDAFAEIATWHEYPAVLDLACFAVVGRPGSALASLGEQVPALAARLLGRADAGGRAAIDPKPGQIALIPARTPDVSSTMIRMRVERGLDLDGLVPAAVEAHIRRHHLYLPDPEPPGRQLA